MNMVNNSLRHAFGEEDFGVMRMRAELFGNKEVRIYFGDNGKGHCEGTLAAYLRSLLYHQT